MAKYSKWITGGLGWAMFGPIGGLLGFILGSYIDNMSKDLTVHSPTTTHSGDFGVSLLILAAAIMKADNRIMRSELDYVKKFFLQNFGEKETLERMHLLREIIKQDIPIIDVCQQIREYMDYSSRLELLHFLWGIAGADGKFDSNETILLENIARYFGISIQDATSIKAMFIKATDSAYKILEISQDATDEEIKKAYRKMALKYHPDRLEHLGDDVKKDANNKFQKINEAYETIKKERNIA
jgi:DnaJ like chaperone protein